jgi:hypothetical protein
LQERWRIAWKLLQLQARFQRAQWPEQMRVRACGMKSAQNSAQESDSQALLID